MATCPDYNCLNAIGDQSLNACNQPKPGGSQEIILLKCGHTVTNASSETQVQNSLDNEGAKLFKRVKVGMPLASPVKVPAMVSCEADIQISADRTVTIMDPNINATTVATWNGLTDGSPIGGMIIFICGEENANVWFIDDPITFEGSPVLPDDNTDLQHEEIIGNWRAVDAPTYTAAPPNILANN